MEYRKCSAFILFSMIFLIVGEFDVKQDRFSVSRAFLVYRTVSITQKSCTCSMTFSCSCCQSVVILYTKAEKNLCVNFTYQRNGLNIDVSLDSATIKAQTTTNYKSVRFCVHVPYCLFSTACINILELNRFPRSITACLRLEIFSKKQLWQINYDCISISTQLPTIPNMTTPISTTNMTTMPTKSIMPNSGMTSTTMIMSMEMTSIVTTPMSTETMPMMMPMATTMMSTETTQMTMNEPMTTGPTQNTMTNTASVESTSTGSMAAAAPENVTNANNMPEI